jgi:AraC family transcriptional regulator
VARGYEPDFSGEAWATAAPPDYRGGRLVTCEHKTWLHATAVLTQLRSDGDVVQANLTANFTRLVINLEEVGGPFVISGDGLDSGRHQIAGGVSVIPAGMDAQGSATKMRYLRQLMVQIDRSVLEDAFEETIAIDLALAPRAMVDDQRLVHLGRIIADECGIDQETDRLFWDSISIALFSALAGCGRVDAARTKSRGGLAPWQVRRTTDFIREKLSDDIDLAMLADGVGLSKSHFCREFKETTGMPPHKWLVNARIDKSKEHLLAGRLSLAEIALEVGFSDQSHFTRTFTKSEGTSPRAWLRSRL